MTKHLVLDDVDMAAICGQLSATGVTSFRILEGNFRESLLHEATCYRYKPEEEIVGSKNRRVRQQVESFKNFPDESQFILLKNSFQTLVDRGLADLPVYPFETRLRFSSLVLQKYRKEAITPTETDSTMTTWCVSSISAVEGGSISVPTDPDRVPGK